MLRLHTFGSVYIASEDGPPLTGAGAQRRLLALLSVLSAAGAGGVSRDKLLGLLWPDGDPERARHALTQALYHARRVLRCEDLILGGTDLRLNPDRVTSDVAEMEAAMARRDFEQAAAVYQGPFLDGFYLAGSTEFEPWASAQRDRYQRLAAEALTALAADAESAGDYRRAADWWRRLASLDPLDSGVAVKLMSALAAGGDHAGAIQHARVHERLLRDELDVPPAPAVVALADQLRDDPAWTPLAGRPVAGAAVTGTVTVEESPAALSPRTASPASDAGPSPEVRPVSPENGSVGRPRLGAPQPGGEGHRRMRRGRFAAAGLVLAVALLVAAVLTVRSRTAERRLADSAAPAPVTVVAPFRVTGADASLSYLREGLVDLIATRLGDDRERMRAADPASVMTAWRAAGLPASVDPPRADVLRLAQRLGASQAIVGSVVGTPTRLVVSASLLGVHDAEPRARATVEGPADSLTSLVDRLVVSLIAEGAGEGDRLASHTTPSLPALRAYLDGQAAYRRGAFASAADHFDRALRDDSAFALAAFGLALAADRLNSAEQHDRGLALAWAARDELSARDRRHLEAFAGPRYPAPSSAAEQLAAWERAVAVARDRADVWQELGERYVYDGALLGVDDPAGRATLALRRALEMDSSRVAARRLLVELAVRRGDTATLRRLLPPPAAADTALGAGFTRWRVAAALGDDASLRRARAAFPALPDEDLRAVAMAGQFDAAALPDGERALRIWRGRPARGTERLDVLLAQHSLALNQGRPVLALDLTEQIQEVEPGLRAHLRLRVLDALYSDGDRAAAAAAARQLGRYADAPPATTASARALQLADLCVLAQWRLAEGEPGLARRAVAQLRAGGALPDLVVVGATPLACAELLEASLATGPTTTADDSAARRGVERVDSLMLSGPAVSDAGQYAGLVIARLYDRLGSPDRALAAVRRRGHMNGWPRYRSTMLREEGRLAEAAGDREGAVRAYREYLALRTAPEAELASEAARVRAALAALERGRRP